MPTAPSARLDLIAPVSGDSIYLWPAQMQAIVARLEAVAAMYRVGTAGARGAASADNVGEFYFATDSGILSVSAGGLGWVDLNDHASAPPISSTMGFGGSADPPSTALGKWVLADGRLIDRTTYAGYFALVGHRYNQYVDPGGNMVRIQDKRGRVTVGTDDMGTARGAAGRILSAPNVAGYGGGAERHTLSIAEMPVHNHVENVRATLGSLLSLPQAGSGDTAGPSGTGTEFTGGGVSHNNMQPYEVENMIVRIL